MTPVSLATGKFGDAQALLEDRDSWYKSVSNLAHQPQPSTDLRTVDDAYERILRRARLDDKFSHELWPNTEPYVNEVSTDIELRPQLWVSNLGGNDSLRCEFRSRLLRACDEDATCKLIQELHGVTQENAYRAIDAAVRFGIIEYLECENN